MVMNKTKQRIETNLVEVNRRIDTALKAALRNRAGLTLVAVTKRQPLAVVQAGYQLGLRDFGENQIQEAIPKIKAGPDDITWHFIGNLQKNKVRKAVKHFKYIHAIDSLGLLQRVAYIAKEERLCPSIFLQVNYALDPDKQGLHPEAVKPVLGSALALPTVECIGLMGIPPLAASPSKIEAYFKGMVNLRNEMKGLYPDWPGKLSLGMSGDFEAAISCGSHYIRLGTVLFGERG